MSINTYGLLLTVGCAVIWLLCFWLRDKSTVTRVHLWWFSLSGTLFGLAGVLFLLSPTGG
jgi:hypothetical protein